MRIIPFSCWYVGLSVFEDANTHPRRPYLKRRGLYADDTRLFLGFRSLIAVV